MEHINKLNAYIINISLKLKEFFFKYRFILLLSFIIGILINSVDIFTFKFNIDNTVPPYHHFLRSRYGSLILYKLFPFLQYNHVSQIMGVISLILASLLMVSKYKFSNTSKFLFIITFISAIYFTHLQYFFFQSAYNFIALLFTVLAYRLIDNNKIIYHVLAVFLLFIGITSYQTNLAVFLSTLMIGVILDFIDNKNIKASIYKIFKGIIILLITLLIYYVITKIPIINTVRSHHAGMIYWLHSNADYTKITINLLKLIFKNEIWTILFLAVSFIYSLFYFKNIKERIFFIVLAILFILAVFSFNILMGNNMPLRARTQLAVLPAFTFLLIYNFKNYAVLKFLVIIACIINFSINSTKNIHEQTAYKLGYEQSKMTASKIFDLIYTKYPEIYTGQYNIAFYGTLPYNQMVLRNSSDYMRVSWFTHTARTHWLLRALGLPDNIKHSKIIIWTHGLKNAPEEVKKIIKEMPAYPHSDCVYKYDNTIIVKLSEYNAKLSE